MLEFCKMKYKEKRTKEVKSMDTCSFKLPESKFHCMNSCKTFKRQKVWGAMKLDALGLSYMEVIIFYHHKNEVG